MFKIKRDLSIDISKGIGILLIILGHLPNIPPELKKIIYSFHVPMFFIISGYLYNKAKYQNFTLKEFAVFKFKRLMIPYFFIGFSCFLLFGIIMPAVVHGIDSQFYSDAINYFFGLIYSYGSPKYMAWSSPLWFMTCTFVTEIIFYLINKYSDHIYISIFGTVLIGYFYNLFLGFRLPWNIDIAFIAVGFMYVGQLIRNSNLLNKLFNLKYSMVLLLLFILSIYFNVKIDLNMRNYGIIILTFCSSISGSLLVINLSKLIKNNSLLIYFGSNSLYMMGYTYAVLNATNFITPKFVFLNNLLVNFLFQETVLGVGVFALLKILNLYKKKKTLLPLK